MEQTHKREAKHNRKRSLKLPDREERGEGRRRATQRSERNERAAISQSCRWSVTAVIMGQRNQYPIDWSAAV